LIDELESGIPNDIILELFKKALIIESNQTDLDLISAETFRQIINDYKIGGVGRLMLSDHFNKLYGKTK
jgi:hypothetical protein